jgi:hypothetical protein
MDILAGMLAYVAGIGALLAALAISFSVFFAAQNPPVQTETQPRSATAMVVRPSPAGAPNKPTVIGALARPTANRAHHPERHAAAATSGAGRSAAAVRDLHRKPAGGSAQARRLLQEQRARRWAYQQDSSQGSNQGSNQGPNQASGHEPSFQSRFLGYAD